jgi:hypothetical protein
MRKQVKVQWTPAQWQTEPDNVVTEKVQLWSASGTMFTAQLPNAEARKMIANGSCFVISSQAIGWIK